jgi:hypothetical protein
MATAVRNLTKMGTDVRKIAALLRAKAPEGHMLAYISPEEAQLLKDRGGSGKPHADTGIPSFANEMDSVDMDVPLGAQREAEGGGGGGGGVDAVPGSASYMNQEAQTVAQPYFAPTETPQVKIPTSAVGFGEEPISTPTAPTPAGPIDIGFGPGKYAPEPTAPAPKGKDLGDILGSKLGVAGITGLLGALQAKKAGQAGQQGAQDIQKLAAPYQQTGQQLQAQAQAGALTPAGQQSLQALQAQVAQGVQARGGVGAQQAQAAVEQLRQQLLQQQYDYGLKLSGIGDNIAIGAIKTGMQADQYANQLTSSYFNNIARIASGTPTATPQVGVTA